jgi:thiol-disulfide isomerase/thioredoxin
VRDASRLLRAEPVAFAWLDKSQWDGVRAGLSGTRYPALTIDDIRFVNRRYAYDESAPITTPAVVAWVQKLLAGQLAHTNFSQPLALAADNAAAAVKVLVLDNFAELVERRSTNLFVMFHSPTCGTCQSLYAPFEQLARHYAGDARLSFLKGEAWMNDFPEWLRLSGVPDLRFFAADQRQRSLEFEGNDRSFDAMRRWLDARLQTTTHDEL